MTVLSQTSAESDKSNNPLYNLFEANINFLSDYQKTEVKKIKGTTFQQMMSLRYILKDWSCVWLGIV